MATEEEKATFKDEMRTIQREYGAGMRAFLGMSQSCSFDRFCATGDLANINKAVDCMNAALFDVPRYLNAGINDACKHAQYEVVDRLLALGADDFNNGLRGACEGGHAIIVERMLKLGAKDFDGGLLAACSGKHVKIAERMIEFGATDFNAALYKACDDFDLDVKTPIIALILEHHPSDFMPAMCAAIRHGNSPLIRQLIDIARLQQPAATIDFNSCLAKAGGMANRELIDLMIANGANNLNGALRGAHEYGCADIVDYVIGLGATECCGRSIDWHHRWIAERRAEYVLWAVGHCDRPKVERLIAAYESDKRIHIDFTKCLTEAQLRGDKETNDARKHGYQELANLMIAHGASQELASFMFEQQRAYEISQGRYK